MYSMCQDVCWVSTLCYFSASLSLLSTVIPILFIFFSRDLAQLNRTNCSFNIDDKNNSFRSLCTPRHSKRNKGARFSPKHNGKLVLARLCLSRVFIMGLGAWVQFPLSAAIGLDKRDEWKDITRQEGLSIAAPRGRWRRQAFDGVRLILWEPLIYADCAISLWGICNFLQVWSITAALLRRMLTMSQSKNKKKSERMRKMGGGEANGRKSGDGWRMAHLAIRH